MKKLLFTILMMLPILANAYDFKIGDIYYNYINNGKEVEVTYNEYLQNSYPLYDGIEISSEVTYGGKTLKVTAIGDYAFYNCSRLKSISIPNSVTIIGNNAFACSGLQSVSIPNSVTDINKAAFCECNSLKKISIGSGVKTIYSFAFADCPNLTEVYCYAVNVPKMLDYMYLNSCTNAFQNSNIGNATLHVPAESVSAYKNKEPWNGFKSIVSLSGQGGGDGGEQTTTGFYAKNADGVNIYYNYINGGNELEVTYKSAGYATYSGVVNIPESVTYNGKTMKVTSIGDLAFFECLNLTTISIPSSMTNISLTAFLDCLNLKNVTINSNSLMSKDCNDFVNMPLTTIFDKAEQLVIGDDVKSLGRQVFFGSSYLKSVTIGSGVTNMAEDAFGDCLFITSLTINSNNIVSKNYTDNTSLIKVFGRGLNSIKIGEKVTSIGNYAFYDCANLLTLTLPNTITSIGDNAFSNCTFLTSLSIPNSVKSIGEYAFYGCTSMSSLSLGNSLENIGKCTFYGGVIITEIYSSAANPPACDSSVFAGVNTESCIVYVPTGSSESYKNSEEWRDFKNIKESAALGISQKNVEEAVAVGIYDMGGHRQSGLQRGVNIIRMSNGKTQKILVK